MSYGDLRIDFDGLVSLVPMKKADAPGEASKWVVALADLRRTLVPGPGFELPATIAPHVACVIVPDDAVIDVWSTKAPSLIFESRDSNGKRLRLYELQEHGLKVDYAGKSGLKAVSTPTRSASPFTPQEAHDLTWVAQMSRVGLPRAGEFDSDLIDANLLPADATARKGGGLPGLTGVVEIDGGTLRVDDVLRYKDRTPLLFEFKARGGPAPHTQAQGAHIMLEDELTTDTVRLRFGHRGASGSSPQWQDLVLRPSGDGLYVRVANLELEVVLGLGSAFEPTDSSADLDFAVHYVLSAGWPFTQKLPVPHLVGTRASEFGGSTRETCKGSVFLGLAK